MNDHHAITWFEIPAADLARAGAFYEHVLGTPLRREDGFGEPMLILPYAEPGVGGCLRADAAHAGAAGPVIYLRLRDDLDAALARAQAAGARLLKPRTDLPDGMGAFAQIADSEGNRIGLHHVPA